MSRHLRREIATSGLWILCGFLVSPGCSKHTDHPQDVVRIGYQKTGTLNLVRLRGTLAPDLALLGACAEWIGFPAGPQLLEALNAGAIDFGHTGDAPPILAQSAGAPLVYVAHEPSRSHSEAIIVPAGSPLRTIADLKSKRVALNKGSNVHYLLVRALESAGIAYDQVNTVFLSPSDARAAFEGGSVDAWAVWDPYLAGKRPVNPIFKTLSGRGIMCGGTVFPAKAGRGTRGRPRVQPAAKARRPRSPRTRPSLLTSPRRRAQWPQVRSPL